MAEAARTHRGELVAWHAAVIVGHMPFVGRQLDPRAINPYPRARRDSAKLRRIKEFIAARGLACLARGKSEEDD
jgi:hypothetical protein